RDLSPTCLGRDHLVEALSENPCMNCSFMPRALRVARLAQLCPQDDADLTPSGQVAPLRRSKHRDETTVSVPPSRRKRAKSDQALATRVEQLSTELAEMKSLLQSCHSDASLPTAGLSSPPMPDLSVEEDVLSLAASASQFRDEEEAQSSPASETGSFSSQSAVGEPSDGSMREVKCMALRQLQLELLLGEVSATGSAFFRRGRAPFSVPPSEEYPRELQACWWDPRALSRAHAGRLGNSMAHLMFALSASLQDAGGATTAVGFINAALQAFALMTRELGRVMSFLVQARRRVWLAQSPLTEACRRTLRGVPVVPGELFGSAAVEALEQTVQARQTSQQLSGLRRSMPPPPPQRSSCPSVSPSARPPPQHGDRSVGFYPREVRQRPSRDFCQPVHRPVRQTQDPGRPHPRAPRDSGGRR
ncbi:hypothetical protein GOODEAATRI_002672, partial [Goodea atripinnis]